MGKINKVYIKIVCLISVEVEAKNKSEAMEKAQDLLMRNLPKNPIFKGINIEEPIELAPQSFIKE